MAFKSASTKGGFIAEMLLLTVEFDKFTVQLTWLLWKSALSVNIVKQIL